MISNNISQHITVWDYGRLYSISKRHYHLSHNDVLSQFESFIACDHDNITYHICQEHYLLLWNSTSREYSKYKKIIRNEMSTSISYSMHTTLSHINRLHDVIKVWNGKIYSAIFFEVSQWDILVKNLRKINRNNVIVILYAVDNSNLLKPENNCYYETVNNITSCIKQTNNIYPINTLRNLLYDIIEGYVFDCDADVIPSPNVYSQLMTIDFSNYISSRTAFIIPLFQYTVEYRKQCSNEECYEKMFNNRPKNILELISCFRNRHCQIANAHLKTRRVVNTAWWSELNSIQELPCFPFKLMEPYVLIHMDRFTTYYNESFFNYGYNKVQHILKMRVDGYNFKVLTKVFAFDAPHAPSNMSAQYEGNYKYISRKVWVEFLTGITKTQLHKNICNITFALEHFPTLFW